MTKQEAVCDIPGLDPQSYARWRASDVGATTERLERRLIVGFAGDVRGRSVLDIGCGDGDLAAELAKGGARVVGIDVSQSIIAAARERAARDRIDATFGVASAQSLPFGPERFDVVVAVTILCFVEDAAPVFREMARVLRPGGLLVIGELGKWSSWAAARRVRGWLGSPLWRHGRFRTAQELRSLATKAGFTGASVRGAVYYPRTQLAARLLAPCDRCFSEMTTFGAAFLALRASKPETPSGSRAD